MIMVAKFISSGDIGTGPAETAPVRPRCSSSHT